ncbi:hypothetical protein RF55_10282 [Lasius niger]|uniref:Uncharacterized protein n=1 Tax=Lasius niger TaxID=67767 RepID=A0A0J7KIH2_LASNI|nr:hypothetical protein RF55_10282 [Lasius niger]
MSLEDDIVREINALLGEAELPGPQKPPGATANSTRPPFRPPKVGTVIQRSDRINRRKIEILATPPPPLAACRRRRSTPQTPPPRQPAIATSQPGPASSPSREAAPHRPSPPPQVLTPIGPAPPPPVLVELEPGYI